jgi:hypothetical protein
LDLDSVVTCTPHVPGVSDTVNVGIVPKTISCLSSVARRLSRVFRLRYDARNQEDRKEMTSKENVHGHERAEVEPNHDEGGY